MRAILPAAAMVLFGLASCGTGAAGRGGRNALNTREVVLPDGSRIQCEVMIRPEDMARGMMYRDTLAPDRGMLFIHSQPGRYPYWMHNVKVPLDIIWLDAQRRIVEMSPHTPPCQAAADQCPNYGGNKESITVLEMAAGSIQRHGLALGNQLRF
jgi:uncharacterized membrane protein (UPF0127 family)